MIIERDLRAYTVSVEDSLVTALNAISENQSRIVFCIDDAGVLVEPLVRHDQIGRGDLVNSLRVWLKNNGQWDPAAAQLGVHRHTLRQRIHKAERLLDRPIDSPNTRAELWLALQVLDNSPF